MVETRVEHFTPGVATDHAMETVAGEHNQLRVLELYSGIGGMHCALKDSGLNYKIVAAVDINEKANIIYKHNFRETNLLQRNIESISVQQLDKMKIDLLTMSPPCQPFTRLGCQKDVSDPRAKSFLYLLNTLPKLENQPKYILLENVKGFETSNARAAFREMLDRCGYIYKCWSSVCGGQLDDRKLLHNCQDSAMRTLGSYLSPHDMESRHQLPQQLVTRFLKVMDVVSPQSTRSCCFTKAYGRYIEGTGSVLLSDFTDSIHIVEGKAMHGTCAAPSTLRLSYFSPKDIANIMCFPTDYTFPKDCTSRDCYKVLGNSINIYVVSVLLRLLTLGDDL
ncbi:PREDICTED: tRNA (cytosine(38)-C(5))-methyltransferase-like isoform X3 [Priapulus caudatus]|uniref:tRNA (cytosine(38)-C(5))-methyltransferase n=1 Tax=Priapulus caudatus TaxID=37621 RepID=A0ABM1ETU6_PRICU|nr:PREDICTED: tRNA (cytosine(38)-C(5))-methyltransferase-like isoform X3 [Priapulus caudatus]